MGGEAFEIEVCHYLTHRGGVDLRLALGKAKCQSVKTQVIDDSRNTFAVCRNQVNRAVAEQRGPRISGLAQPILDVDHCFYSRKWMKPADARNPLAQLRQTRLGELVRKLWLARENDLQELGF